MTHTGIGLYLSNDANKTDIIQQILSNNYLNKYVDLGLLKGALYSSITINRYVEEEIRHDRFFIQTDDNQSLGSMSSGQQKRALLHYLIAQNPEYLVLDDVYSNIDKDFQAEITQKINQLSRKTIIIQLFFRKSDVLNCINKVLSIDNHNTISKEESAFEFKRKKIDYPSFPPVFKLPHEYNSNHVDINPLIQMTNVTLSYLEKKVVKNINWTIEMGEFWQLIGPNGSGKSTLLSIITGDNPRGYGQNLVLFGKKKGSGESIWDIKRQIGYFTPAMTDQFKHDDTVENMIISGIFDSIGLYTTPSDIQKAIGKSWLKMLGPGYENKTFRQLSVGQQRMVMVARAMVKHPPLLILDEPTTELDDLNSQLFIQMINALSKEGKIAILYVSHRDEPGLKPGKIFELIPGSEGSTGKISG